jgi:LysM repeat protein
MRRVFSIVIYLSSTFFLFANPLAYRYIDSYKDIAIAEMRRTGIPASIKLAQGMIESDMGRSPLATEANNHFGIKCGREWQGETFYKLDDDRDSLGNIIESCFRSYSLVSESYLAHSAFLSNPAKQSRYGFLFNLPTTDYAGWANGLKMAGYATDPSYPSKLTKVINLYKLHQYDEEVLKIKPAEPELLAEVAKSASTKKTNEPTKVSDTKVERVEKTTNKSGESKNTTNKSNSIRYMIERINNVEFVTCIGGESLTDIAKAQKVDVFDLLSYNEAVSSPHSIMGRNQKVYLQPKKKSSSHEWHTVVKGETLYDISQKYGVKLQTLAYKNNVKPNAVIEAGQKVSLDRQLSRRETPDHNYPAQFDKFIDMGDE